MEKNHYQGLINKYREYLPVTDKTPIITLNEGNTPLIKADNFAKKIGLKADVYFKYEGANPTGSFKDRGMTMAVTKAVEEGAKAIAIRSRGTPRIANRLVKRVSDFAIVKYDGVINEVVANESLDVLKIDAFGLDTTDRALLNLIIEKYDGGPVGVETIAAALSEDVRTIEDVCEPYLLQAGFLQRTPRGRKVSPEGYRHLGLKQPSEQKTLFDF